MDAEVWINNSDKRMNGDLLITNDDGIDADGLIALERAFPTGTTVVAPAKGMSLCSHQVTTDRPLKLAEAGENRYSVDGTPADCVRLAKEVFMNSDRSFRWVLSGVNRGGNLGVDLLHSGTVAAVREAAIYGLSGIAFSQYLRRGLEPNWEWSTRQVLRVWEKLQDTLPEPGTFWNVNFPHLDAGDGSDPAIVYCGVSRQPLPVEFMNTADGWVYKGIYSNRHKESGSDIDHVFNGRISISSIRLWNH